jgi:cell division protein FtsL
VRGARAATAAAVAPRGIALPRPSLPRPQLVHAAQGFSLSRAAHSVLHGRGWIGLLTVLLLGVVFMQVHMLKLNAGVSRAVEAAATLEKQNAQLRQDVSQLAAADRIEDAAAMFGMAMPQPGAVRYLEARAPEADARRAVRTMSTPDATAAAAATAPAVPAAAPAPASAPPPVAASTPPAAAPVPAQQPSPAPGAVPPPPAPAAAQAAPASAAPAQIATGGVTPGQP